MNWARSSRVPPRPASYHRMTAEEKQRHALGNIRSVGLERCAVCLAVVLSRQMDDHRRDRCPGKPWSEVAGPAPP